MSPRSADRHLLPPVTVSRGEVEALIEFALLLVLLAVILVIIRQR